MRKPNWESRLLGGVQPARRRCVSLAAVAAACSARGVFTIDARREGGRWTVDLVTPAPVEVVTGEGERALPAGSHRVHLAVVAAL